MVSPLVKFDPTPIARDISAILQPCPKTRDEMTAQTVAKAPEIIAVFARCAPARVRKYPDFDAISRRILRRVFRRHFMVRSDETISMEVTDIRGIIRKYRQAWRWVRV